MSKKTLGIVAIAAAIGLFGVGALSIGTSGLSPQVLAGTTTNSAVIKTQATAGSGNFDVATVSTTSHLTGTFSTVLDLLDSSYDFTVGSGANINFHISGTVSQFSFNGTAHGNNEVMDVWARVASTDGETLCYRTNQANGTAWYGGQAGQASLSGASDNAEHIASIANMHYFRINIWSAGGTSMSIKNLTFNWTC